MNNYMDKGGIKANKINGFEDIKKKEISWILGQNRDPVPSSKCPSVHKKRCKSLKSAVLEINAKGQSRAKGGTYYLPRHIKDK